MKPNPIRREFSTTELAQLFSVKQYKIDQYRHPFHYWLMLIGLHTGARLNEICQLCVSDIYTINNIFVFDFNQNHPSITRKSLKSSSCSRLVPVHSTLINLNFAQFVNDQNKGNTHDRLFPELKWQPNGGYSKYARQWFNEILKTECGIASGPGSDFHVFRATVASHLRNTATANDKEIGAIFGHADRTADTNHNAAKS